MAVVIGITGCTRCGKGRVAAALSEKLGGVEIVGQDNFWQGPRPDPSGQMSDEEPACTDNAAFAREIETAARKAQRYVIAEGFQLLHDASVRALLGPVHFLDLGRDECIRRRAQPRGPHNPHPISKEKLAAVVWPAHERHMAAAVDPLGARVTRHPAPATDAQVGAIAEAIFQHWHHGCVGTDTLPPPPPALHCRATRLSPRRRRSRSTSAG